MGQTMQTVDVTSLASPPATIRQAYPLPASAVCDPDAAEVAGQAVFDSQQWTYRNGFDAVLRQTPRCVWESPHKQGWQRIKHNARREVWRAQIAGVAYYLKYYCTDDWAARLKAVFRDSACRAEWTGGVYALRAGIAAVAPAGYTMSLRGENGVRALLVTEAAEPAYPLNEFHQQIEADDDPRRRRRDTAQLVELLSEMIARAHQAGFEHLDMHAATILVKPIATGQYRTLFVDLHSARLGVPISDRAVVRNLAQLNQWFRRHSSISERLRFLRAYVRWRNEYEPTFAYGRPLGLSYRQLMQALVKAADRHASRLSAQRDRRTRRDGRYFTRVRLPGGWRAVAVVQTKHQTDDSRASGMLLQRKWWAGQLANPLRWFADDSEQACKDSHSACVRRALLNHPAGNLPIIVKRPLARNWRRRMSQLLTPSRSVRGWRTGHALLHRHVPTARPLAALERRFGPFVRDSVLITEAIPGAVDLERHLHKQHAARRPSAWFVYKRELCELVALHVRQLQQRCLLHRDCKASNILVVEYPRIKLLWIDMDGLRPPARRPGQRQLLAPLVRLHVSLLTMPGLTRTDRVRFLKRYCAGFGSGPRAWRALWRELTPLVEEKLRGQETRRAWKLKHYGRE